jgi:hypothetical protein
LILLAESILVSQNYIVFWNQLCDLLVFQIESRVQVLKFLLKQFLLFFLLYDLALQAGDGVVKVIYFAE